MPWEIEAMKDVA